MNFKLYYVIGIKEYLIDIKSFVGPAAIVCFKLFLLIQDGNALNDYKECILRKYYNYYLVTFKKKNDTEIA